MSEDVVKKVRVQYTVEDQAAGPLGRIAEKAGHAGGAVEKLRDRFKEFRGETALMAAGVLGVGFGLGAWVEKAKEANREFGGAQKSIASTMATILDWPRAMAPVEKFTRSMGLAKGVTQELDEKAADYGLSLTDLASAYKTIGVAAAPMKLSQEQWLNLAVQSAAAAKQFGTDASGAADLIGKALVNKAIRPAGDLGLFLKNEVGGNLHKLNNAQVLDRMNRALSQSTKIAEQMGQGMGGSIARIQNRVDDLFRDVTGPLFHEVAKELDVFAKKLKEGGDAGRPMIEVVSGKLLSGFRELKDDAAFIADHWKTIALVVGGMKLSSTVGQLGEIARGIRDVTGSAGKVGGAGGLAGLASSIGPVVAGLAAFKIGLDALISWFEKNVEERRGQELRAAGSGGSLQALASINARGAGPLTSFQDRAARDSMAQLQKAGIVTPKGDVDMGKFSTDWRLMEGERKKRLMDTFGIQAGPMVDPERAVAKAFAAITDRFLPAARPLNGSENDANRKTTGKPQVLFTGANHWEMKFEDVDPDRIMLRFKDDMENYVGRRTSSVLSDPLGD